MTPEEFSPHCPRTEDRNTPHLWTIQHLRVHIMGPLGPSEESPSSLCELGKCRVGGPDRGPGVGLGARWEASLHPSGLEDMQQSSPAATKGYQPEGGREGKAKARGPRGRTPAWLKTLASQAVSGPGQGVLGRKRPLSWLHFPP